MRAQLTRTLDEDFDSAIALSREAVALTPNDADAYVALAETLIFADQAGEALPLIRKAMRLNPYYPDFYESTLVLAYFFNDDLDRALSLGREVISKNPNQITTYAVVISALGHLGQKVAAAPIIDALQAQRVQLGQGPYFPKEVRLQVFRNPKPEKKLYDGLIMADMRNS